MCSTKATRETVHNDRIAYRSEKRLVIEPWRPTKGRQRETEVENKNRRIQQSPD